MGSWQLYGKLRRLIPETFAGKVSARSLGRLVGQWESPDGQLASKRCLCMENVWELYEVYGKL